MDTWGDGWNEETKLTITGISDLDPLAIDLPDDAVTTTRTDNQGNIVVSVTRTISLDSTGNSSNRIHPLGKIFEANLQNGHHDFAGICLVPNRCYRLIVTGPREFLEENSWELRPESQGSESKPILSGSAPTGCTFSLPDESGHHFCENTCSEEILAQATADPAENAKEDEVRAAVVSTAKTLVPVVSAPEEPTIQKVVVKEANSYNNNKNKNRNNGSSVLNNFKLVGGED